MPKKRPELFRDRAMRLVDDPVGAIEPERRVLRLVMRRKAALLALGSVVGMSVSACDPGIAPAVVVNGCAESVRVLFDEEPPGVDVNPDSWKDLAVDLAPGARHEAYAIHQNGLYVLIIYPDSRDPIVTRIPFTDGKSPEETRIEGEQCGGSS